MCIRDSNNVNNIPVFRLVFHGFYSPGTCSDQVNGSVNLDFLTRMGVVTMLGVSRTNKFCECAIVGVRTTSYIVICELTMLG